MKVELALSKLAKAGAVETNPGANRWLRTFQLNGWELRLSLCDGNGCSGPAFQPAKVSAVAFQGDFYGISVTKAIQWAQEKKRA